ncbi:helix-turn-helix domain-containing protein [Rubinisphaera italica]|uniref:Arginine utilization regulatory protein RocR n=1 Tax=Rubinisphaera italica TaxID=2527969 RepID=A0A5C5XBJ5_9PLAN|nr:helix-turn-helix domain-containing protein [Rubinisphaera italica]TWT60009.1 Arginine utilization regulatory protein RocR [Rubinisphaera italica]
MVEFGHQETRIVQNDPYLQELRRLADRNSVLLIVGESGTGKQTLARKFHHFRTAKTGTFRILVGKSISSNSGSKLARLRVANWKRQLNSQSAGTLLIPNIDRLSRSLQLDLLKLIKSRYDRENQEACEPLVMMTANPTSLLEPMTQAASKEFIIRQKLERSQFDLPPLREYSQQITQLVRQFLSSQTAAGHTPIHYIESAYLQKLQQHSWPGNLRELNAVVSDTLDQCSGPTITIADLPAWFQPKTCTNRVVEPEHLPNGDYLTRLEIPTRHHRFGEKIAKTEQELITNALADCEHNRTQAAQSLGISRVTLYNKMKKLGMSSHRSSRVDEN